MGIPRPSGPASRSAPLHGRLPLHDSSRPDVRGLRGRRGPGGRQGRAREEPVHAGGRRPVPRLQRPASADGSLFCPNGAWNRQRRRPFPRSALRDPIHYHAVQSGQGSRPRQRGTTGVVFLSKSRLEFTEIDAVVLGRSTPTTRSSESWASRIRSRRRLSRTRRRSQIGSRRAAARRRRTRRRAPSATGARRSS